MKMLKTYVVATLFLALSLLAPLIVTATEPPEAFEPSELDVLPQVIKRGAPVYPANLKKRDITGSVVVEFVIDKKGAVIWAKATKSTHPEFEKAAIEAVLQWKFVPGKKGGTAVSSRVQQLLGFRLEGIPISVPETGLNGQPQLINAAIPEYPPEMEMAGLQGEVSLEFVVDVTGHVSNPVIIESNNPWFERPALEAVLKWQFKPARIDGRVVSTSLRQKMVFTLDNGGRQLWEVSKTRKYGKLPEEIHWDTAPVPVMTNFPVYPYDAYMAGKSGKVTVAFVINQDGWIEQIELRKADAPEFGASVMASLDAWRFTPAKKGDESCATSANMTFDFHPSRTETVPVSPGMKSVAAELRSKVPKIFQLTQLDAMPRPLSRRPPVYPSTLLSTRPTGDALIGFYIDQKGDAQLPRIVSATAPEFGYAAVQAAATWRFEPPMKEGKPVIARAQIPIKFETPAGPKQANETTPQEKQP